MGMVAPEQRIASPFAVVFGHYGDVSRYAAQRGICRQSATANRPGWSPRCTATPGSSRWPT
jgi:hypothetical protein